MFTPTIDLKQSFLNKISHQILKLTCLTGTLLITVTSSAFAQTVNYGSRTDLNTLRVSFTRCRNEAYRTVSNLAPRGFRESGNGFSGRFENTNLTLQITCIEVQEGSVVNILIVYIGNPAAANQAYEQAKSVFYRN